MTAPPSTRDDAPAEPVPAASDVEAARLGLVRAVAVGTPAFLVFVPLDLFVRANLHPETSIAWCLGWRALGAAMIAATWLLARRPGWSARGLMLLTGGVLGMSVATLACLALGFGGLASDYVFTPAFYGVGLATFLPESWRKNVLLVGPATVVFTAIIIGGVALSPSLTWQLSDRHAVATFVQNYLLTLGIIVFGIASGHILWRAKRRASDARRLGRYLLRSQLGQGGMNEVWLAWDGKLKREVALKILYPPRGPHEGRRGGLRGPNDARRARFEREARATSALHSEHTIRIYDFGGDDSGTAWIAMEYLVGLDLDGVIASDGPMEPRRAVHVARQAAAALAEAHDLGIVHRDIKPANLFLCAPSPALIPVGGVERRADFVKVLDFGIARQLDSDEAQLTLTGVVVGTPAFMPPEVLRGEPADPRSDVWSLGATLFTLLCGRLPFDFPNSADHFGPDGRRLPALPEPIAQRLPADLAALVRECLSPAPAERPADGRALLGRLEALALAPWSEAEARAWWQARERRAQDAATAPTETGAAPIATAPA
ncbi:MAG: serine/threonine-protein kinase [Myxococcota bacterium]